MEENLYNGRLIRVASGQYVDVFDPNPDTILIEDIAHGLTNKCRFAGHTINYYSVARHSCMVSIWVPKEHQLAALLHDASEAYLGDIPSPIKRLLPEYKKLEDNLMKVIAEKFGFEYPVHELIKEADKKCLEWEWDNHVLNKNNLIMCSAMEKLNFNPDKRIFLQHFEKYNAESKINLPEYQQLTK